MNSDFERELRRHFAEAANAPSDETFVARVAAEMGRRRRLDWAVRLGLATVLIFAATIAGPSLLGAAAYLARLPELLGAPIGAFLVTPAGWAISALAATLVLVRAAGPIVHLRRPR